MHPVRFLLVDDLEENLLSLEALLRRENLVLLKARSGDEALELLLQHDVALALVDVQMPGLNGFELAELMRGNERTRHIPIIFVTAGTADGQRRFRGYEAGAVDFIQKPIEPDILRSKADVFFQLYRQRQQIAAQRDELEAQAEALKEAELDDVKKSVDALRSLNPATEIKKQLNPFEQAAADVRAGIDNAMKPKPAAEPTVPAADAPAEPAEPLKNGATDMPGVAGPEAMPATPVFPAKAAAATAKPARAKPVSKPTAAKAPAAKASKAKPVASAASAALKPAAKADAPKPAATPKPAASAPAPKKASKAPAVAKVAKAGMPASRKRTSS